MFRFFGVSLGCLWFLGFRAFGVCRVEELEGFGFFFGCYFFFS